MVCCPVRYQSKVYPSVKSLMDATGALRTTITRHLNKYGHLEFLGQRKSGRSTGHDKYNEVVEMRRRGLSVYQIRRATGLSHNSVWSILREIGE